MSAPLVINPVEHCFFWPLHQTSSCGEQLIGNTTFLALQRAHARGVSNAFQYANAWVTRHDWERLATTGDSCVLLSKNGDVLAWVGERGGEEVIASDQSLLIRYPWQFLDINEQVVSSLDKPRYRGEVSSAAHIDGVVHLGEGSKILPGVVIEGNVVIGKHCKVGPNCYLRGSTSIGDYCHIGQAVEVKHSIIGHHTSVGHLSYIGDSVIGNKVNIGAGTITSNFRHDGLQHRSLVGDQLVDTGREKLGAIIGDGVHTGILTAIYPGRKLAAGASTRPNDTVQYDLME